MREIDYEDWADYIDALIQKHHPEGCLRSGTCLWYRFTGYFPG